MGDGGAAGCAEVEYAGAGADVDVVEAAEDAGGEFAAEGVPDAVFGFGGRGVVVVGAAGGGGRVDADALFAVDGFAWCEVLGDEEVFFAAAGDEDAGMSVGFLVGC